VHKKDLGLFVPIAVGIGVVLGGIHGFLVTGLKIQPFTVTLCGLLIYRGAARYYMNDATIGFGYEGGFDTLLRLATGRTFGIPHTFLAPVILAAVMGVALHRSVHGRHLLAVGKNEEAVRYSGIATGTVLLQILQNLVDLLGIPSALSFAVMGAVILSGVLVDQQLQRRRRLAAVTRSRAPKLAEAGAAGRGCGVVSLKPACYDNSLSGRDGVGTGRGTRIMFLAERRRGR